MHKALEACQRSVGKVTAAKVKEECEAADQEEECESDDVRQQIRKTM